MAPRSPAIPVTDLVASGAFSRWAQSALKNADTSAANLAVVADVLLDPDTPDGAGLHPMDIVTLVEHPAATRRAVSAWTARALDHPQDARNATARAFVRLAAQRSDTEPALTARITAWPDAETAAVAVDRLLTDGRWTEEQAADWLAALPRRARETVLDSTYSEALLTAATTTPAVLRCCAPLILLNPTGGFDTAAHHAVVDWLAHQPRRHHANPDDVSYHARPSRGSDAEAALHRNLVVSGSARLSEISNVSRLTVDEIYAALPRDRHGPDALSRLPFTSEQVHRLVQDHDGGAGPWDGSARARAWWWRLTRNERLWQHAPLQDLFPRQDEHPTDGPYRAYLAAANKRRNAGAFEWHRLAVHGTPADKAMLPRVTGNQRTLRRALTGDPDPLVLAAFLHVGGDPADLARDRVNPDSPTDPYVLLLAADNAVRYDDRAWLDRAARSPIAAARAAVARALPRDPSPRDTTLLRRLARDDTAAIRAAAAIRVTDKTTQVRLAADPAVAVRLALAVNPRLRADVLAVLADDPADSVRSRVTARIVNALT